MNIQPTPAGVSAPPPPSLSAVCSFHKYMLRAPLASTLVIHTVPSAPASIEAGDPCGCVTDVQLPPGRRYTEPDAFTCQGTPAESTAMSIASPPIDTQSPVVLFHW